MPSRANVHRIFQIVICSVAIVTANFCNCCKATDITVDPAGSGLFKTVQAAIDSVAAKNDERVRILIKPGTYTEHLVVKKPKISLIGQGKQPEDVVLTYNLSARSPKTDGKAGETVGTTGSTSTLIGGADFVAENVTFANSTPDNIAQAVAIKTQADRLAFHKCRFLGFQDTLYPTAGRQYFKDCYVTGDTDFIFGNATAVFDHCTINSSDSGFVTAANTKPETPFGFVFLDCTLTATEDAAKKSHGTFLGRPWQWDRGTNASAAFIRCTIGPHISLAGWHPWDAKNNLQPEKNTRYSEYKNVDPSGKPIDTSQCASWSHQLSDEEAEKYTVEKLLGGDDHWNPAAEFTLP